MNRKRWRVLLPTAVLTAILLAFNGINAYCVNGNSSQQPEPGAARMPEGYKAMAQNSRFALWVDAEQGYLILQDKHGNNWRSVPENYQQDTLAEGSTRFAMESLIQIQYADRLGNTNTLNCKTASVKKQGLKCKQTSNGVLLTFRFPREGFTIPIEATISDEYMEVSLLTDQIEESESAYKLLTVSLLPYFGAADNKAQGYMFVPDGSGALIDLNKPDRLIDDYSQYVYGRELSTTKLEMHEMEQQVCMPVFGLKNGDHAMLGIITSGAGRAIINASVNGKRCSYNNAYAEFIYRDSDLVHIEKKRQTVRLIEKAPPKAERYRVRYYFLAGDQANYVGMAHVFGKWLFEGKKVQRIAAMPLYVEIPGGVMAQESVLGIPVNRVVPLADYNDVKNMASRLRTLGVDDLTITYRYWNKGGTGAAIPLGIQPERRLGGKKAFRSMLEGLKEQNVNLYLDFNFTDMVKSRWGYNTNFDSATSIQRSPALQYKYRINNLKAITTEPAFLLNFNKMQKAVSKVAKSAKSYSFTGISAITLGQKLYSDFSGKTVKRDTADKEWKTLLSQLRTARGHLLLSASNAYALPNADVITDIPIDSSRFMVETRSVPFYAIACHEYVAMTTPDINRMSNPRKGLLNALEAGIGLKYQFLAKNSHRLTETNFNALSGCLFDEWADDAAQTYKQVQSIINEVSGQRIVSHRFLTEDVRKTDFANGLKILVNYGNEDYTGEGFIVKAMGYLVVGA